MNLTSGLPVSAILRALTWYGMTNTIRRDQSDSGAAIRTSMPSFARP